MEKERKWSDAVMGILFRVAVQEGEKLEPGTQQAPLSPLGVSVIIDSSLAGGDDLPSLFKERKWKEDAVVEQWSGQTCACCGPAGMGDGQAWHVWYCLTVQQHPKSHSKWLLHPASWSTLEHCCELDMEMSDLFCILQLYGQTRVTLKDQYKRSVHVECM